MSIRIPDATKTAVEQYATERGIPRNAAYVELIQRGLKVATEAGVPRSPGVPPKAAVERANAAIRDAIANPPKVNVPLAGTFERKPYQKGQKK